MTDDRVRDFGSFNTETASKAFAWDEIQQYAERAHAVTKGCRLGRNVWHLAVEMAERVAEKDAEIARLKEQKKYSADECVRLSNENVRLRGWMMRWKRELSVFGSGSSEIDRALAGEKCPE